MAVSERIETWRMPSGSASSSSASFMSRVDAEWHGEQPTSGRTLVGVIASSAGPQIGCVCRAQLPSYSSVAQVI